MRRIAACCLGLLVLAGCASSRPAHLGTYLPTEPWMDGPPEPMQVIDQSLSRLLLAVPEELDDGMRYKGAEAREIYVQRLRGGAILYARYVDPAFVPAETNPIGMLDSLYRSPLAARMGVAPESLIVTQTELPFGPTWMLGALEENGGEQCAAFFAPMRVGKEAPPAAYDATLRGSLCGTADPKADLVKILRSLVLRE